MAGTLAPARGCDLSWVWKERRPWQPAGRSRLAAVGFFSGARDSMEPAPEGETELAATMHWPARFEAFRGAWDGPVYALTDWGVSSAAEGFVAVLRDNGVAKAIGTPTGRSGCGNMREARLLVLPHSRLKVHTPDCVRLRADGSNEVMGLTPDLPLMPTPGEGARARAARLLSTVEQVLKKDEPVKREGPAAAPGR